MRLKVTVVVGDQRRDIAVVGDALVTVGALADRLHEEFGSLPSGLSGSRALLVNRGRPTERVVAADQPLGDTAIRSGDTVSLTQLAPEHDIDRPAIAALHVNSGRDAPSEFPLKAGTNFLGRDPRSDVRLTDPLVSKRHAKINVGEVIEIIDEDSANGIFLGETLVDRAVLQPGMSVRVGESEISATLLANHGVVAQHHEISFNRSPRLDPVYEGIELKAPTPPKMAQVNAFPVAMMIAPALMGLMMFVISRNPMSLMFVGLSPMMMIGSWWENRRNAKRNFEADRRRYRSALADLAVQLQYAADLERRGRRSEQPSAAEMEAATRDLTDLLWTRRPEHDSFLTCRVGLGTQPSRNSVEVPGDNDTEPELWNELLAVIDRFSLIDRVPVVANLREVGNIGVCGPQIAAQEVLSAIVGEFAALHSPAELVIAGVAGETASQWDWLKWLPHTQSDFSPIEAHHLAGNSAEANALVSAIEDVCDSRVEEAAQANNQGAPTPAILIVVADDAPVERARLVQLAERGREIGVHVVWLARARQRLPAACRIFVDVDSSAPLQFSGNVIGGQGVADLEPEVIDAVRIEALARRLAPLTDSGVRADDQTDLPRSVSFLELSGQDMATDPSAVIDSWRSNFSLPPESGAMPLRRPNGLRALVGQSGSGPIHLDLRTQGPHALVGGTTGAGKSEFLQSWVLGMAAKHSPSRVTFLFVDYKGGAAFADCLDLPHCVGLVTDLSPHLVQRALTSLNAELTHREHILNRKKAKDLFELERRRDPEAPPSLVIIVDEFAALVHEVPEFVDGVVNVAQRGRSLGLNLVLATQRPAGVIKENLRANTNLRVALRMADESDSDDVVGTKLAATFAPEIPGRGVVKTGPGRLTLFQSAYVGGHTTGEPQVQELEVRDLVFGMGRRWETKAEAPIEDTDEPSDIRRIVANIGVAYDELGMPAQRRPWLPELSPVYRLEALPTARRDDELVFGVTDIPEDQQQPPISFRPDQAGNIAVFGTGGSGKSTFLRSLAVAAATGFARGGPTQVYGLDFSARGLLPLEVLPHVGSIISGDDFSRVQRLLRNLREIVDERAYRYSAVNAGSIMEYRERTGETDEPRILVLVDAVGAFRSNWEAASNLAPYWEMFLALAAEGRAAGVHFAMSADRPNAMSAGLTSTVQQRLVLRLANEMDYMMMDVSPDAFSESTPPGRGFCGPHEVQVGAIGGARNIAIEAQELTRLAEAMRGAGIGETPPIRSLPEEIPVADLPPAVDGLPTFGIADRTLEPISFNPSGTFIVSGPPVSGRTSTVATMVSQLRRARPEMSIAYFGQPRSPLGAAFDWDVKAQGHSNVADAASDLAEELADAAPGSWTVVIESVSDFLNEEGDMPLQNLIKAARASDNFVIAEAETSSLSGAWPLYQAIKVSRSGIALQPDQQDGDSLFRTAFPRVARRDFPLGRGLLVYGGKPQIVQVAMPAAV